MPSFRRVRRSPEAEEDVGDILQRSLERWESDQQNAYADALDAALDQIAKFPEIGRSRDDVFPGCRVDRVKQHLIFYRTEQQANRVARVPHEKMDRSAQFPE